MRGVLRPMQDSDVPGRRQYNPHVLNGCAKARVVACFDTDSIAAAAHRRRGRQWSLRRRHRRWSHCTACVVLLRGELGEGAEAGAALCWQKFSDLMVMEGRSFRNARHLVANRGARQRATSPPPAKQVAAAGRTALCRCFSSPNITISVLEQRGPALAVDLVRSRGL